MLPAVTSTLSTVWVGKPCATTLTLYVPSGMSWKANAPSVVVTVLWSILVATSVAFTVAFGTTAPDGSVTVPLIAPRNVCAFATTPKLKIINTARNNRFILPPPDRFSEQLASPRPLLLRAATLTSANHTPLLERTTPQKHSSARHLDAPSPCSRQLKKEKPVRANMA